MIPAELNFERGSLRYDGIIGTGGIGAGTFFVLNGTHTLGREESRSGHFLDMNDYCKQHIILHYIKVLLGPHFEVIPVGKVGSDSTGDRLFREMQETGLDMRHVEKESGSQTLFSFCFSYPDGSGGNLTTDNSASSGVDEVFIENSLPDIERLGKRGMVMAAPEVPLEARLKLIELGRSKGLFCAASFTSGELPLVPGTGVFEKLDLLALNADEAAVLAGRGSAGHDLMKITSEAAAKIREFNPSLMLSVTGGAAGSCCWDSKGPSLCKAALAEAVSTAGAGDAFFAGLLTSLALGTGLPEAQLLATLVAGLSVKSPHTINRDLRRETLKSFSLVSGLSLPVEIYNFLED